MQGLVPPDPSGQGISQPAYATVYMPKFKASRNRFPAACIQICADADEAKHLAAEQNKRFAAVVLGPSKSSEGQLIYYLLEWL